MPLLIMYPEGAVTNGEQILKFKKGAFIGLNPIKICCLKYEYSYWNPFMCQMNLFSKLLVYFSVI